ncbi:MAG TPA: hypothetical protein VFZ34_27875, partial [Blastocatellia bacterium]|nr:hypothetical protein [Blastocatellia bacterium]
MKNLLMKSLLGGLLLMLVTMTCWPIAAVAQIKRRHRGRVVTVPNRLFELWTEYPPSEVARAQAAIDAAARRLGLQYSPVAESELIMYVGQEGGHANGLTEFRNGRVIVKINPDVALNDPVLLELTLLHEDAHVRQYQRLGRAHTFLEEPGLEVEAYEAELRAAQQRGLQRTRPELIERLELRLETQRFMQEQIAALRRQGVPDRDIIRRLMPDAIEVVEGGLAREGSFEDKLKENSSREGPKNKTEVRQLETKNTLLRELLSERTPAELKRIGKVAEYVMLFDLTEAMLREKIGQKFTPEYLRRTFPEIPEARRAGVLDKLLRDRLYELQKARGEVLWRLDSGLTVAERMAIFKTRGYLRTLFEVLIRDPNISFLEGLKRMSAGEAAVLIGPVLVDSAVAWYDHGWQVGLATAGLQGGIALGMMIGAHYSPLVAATLHGVMVLYWPVIVFHVAKGGVYLAGNLFLDYLTRDEWVRVLYLEPGSPYRGLFVPKGTQFSSFFDLEAKGLTRTTLHTRYQTLEQVQAAVNQYRARVQSEIDVTGPGNFALGDVKTWQRIQDRAQADWFDSIS